MDLPVGRFRFLSMVWVILSNKLDLTNSVETMTNLESVFVHDKDFPYSYQIASFNRTFKTDNAQI